MAMTLQQSRLRLTQAIFFGKQPSAAPILTGYVKRDGSTPLTADWTAGNFNINSRNSTLWYNAKAYGAIGNGVVDDGAAIQALLTIVKAAGGGVVYFPSGIYNSSIELSIENAEGVTLLGDSMPVKDVPASSVSVLRYTGAGVRFLNLRSVLGLCVSGLNVTYTNAGFAGALVDLSHGSSGADTANWTIENSTLGGWAILQTAAVLVDLDKVITGTMRNCVVAGGIVGVRGKATNASYSNAITFDKVDFLSQQVAIHAKNAGVGWVFRNCDFNGLVSGQAGAYTQDAGFDSQNLVFDGCWLGDVTLAGGDWIRWQGRNLTVLGNSIASTGAGGTCVKMLTDIASTGLTVIGNQVGGETGVDFVGNGLVNGVVISGNDFGGCVTPVANLSQGAMVIFGNNPSTAEKIDGFTTQLRTDLGAGTGTALITTGGLSNFQVKHTAASTLLKLVNTGGGGIAITKTDGTTPGLVSDGSGNVGIQVLPTRELDLSGTQRYRGIAAPAVSEANSGTIYFDSALNKYRVSMNGGAYVDLVGSGGVTGAGVAGKLAYWTAATNLTDEPNITLGGAYTLDVNGTVSVPSIQQIWDRNTNKLLFDVRSQGTVIGVDAAPLVGAGGTTVAIGNQALASNIAGSANTAVGNAALFVTTTGGNNTAVGSTALVANTGNLNTALGNNSGLSNTTGTQNVFLGASADASAGNLTNAVAIGYQAQVAASNSMVLGNGSMNVGIRTSTPNLPLDVNGAIGTRHHDLALVNGLNSDIVPTLTSFVRITGPTAPFSLGGFTDGVDGRIMFIKNTTAFQMTIVNLDAGSGATNKIKTLTGGNVVLRPGTSACTLIYEDAEDCWTLMSTN